MVHKPYVDLRGQTHALDNLDAATLGLIKELKAKAKQTTEWSEFRNYWMGRVYEFYAAQGLSRAEILGTIGYRIGQDLASRLAVAQGKARLSDYRDELEHLILTRFRTRREFCEATGLSEDMLSHVLARRKHLAIDTLNAALEKVGFTLHIAPLPTTSS